MTEQSQSIQKDITNHLEFLGFELEDIGAEPGRVFVARRDAGINYVISFNGSSVMLTAQWAGFDKRALKSRDFFITINDINREAVSKWYYEESEESEGLTLKVEADYYDYNKKAFGMFLEILEREITSHLSKFQTFYTED